MLGLFETRNQQNLKAVAAYRRALELDPESAEASTGLGMAQSSAGLLADAQATFEAGVKRFPTDAMHRQAYGVLLSKMAETGAAGKARAIEMLESALKLDPSLAEAHYQLGNLALSGDDAVSAAAHFDAAAGRGLDDSRLHYAYARALRRLGREEEASRQLEMFRARKSAEEARSSQP
jgi:tetratricopeptide (TPR) repeat protein